MLVVAARHEAASFFFLPVGLGISGPSQPATALREFVARAIDASSLARDTHLVNPFPPLLVYTLAGSGATPS